MTAKKKKQKKFKKKKKMPTLVGKREVGAYNIFVLLHKQSKRTKTDYIIFSW